MSSTTSDYLEKAKEELIEKAMASRERLAFMLLVKGFLPGDVEIVDKFWYDEETHTIHHECSPVFKEVEA